MNVTTVVKSLKQARHARRIATPARQTPTSTQPQVLRVWSLLLPPDSGRR